MSEARRLLAALVDMLERSNTAHLNYSIIDSNVVYADDLIKAANELLAKPLPEPFTYIGYSAFEKLSLGYAMSVFCAKPAINKSDIPLYSEPTANKREESYSDALRSLASYVGCGGYNADDPIDAKEFEEKIRFGIDLLLSAQSQSCVRKPLSDDEILNELSNHVWPFVFFKDAIDFARIIERKHSIKEQE